MPTAASRQHSQPCWELAALDDRTLRDIGLTRMSAHAPMQRLAAEPTTFRFGLGTGVLLSAVMVGVGLFAV